MRALPFSDASVAAASSVLRSAGVEIVGNQAPDTGTQPVRLTDWQVRNLAAEAANGGGTRAATISPH
jgi:hypothetical protein